MITPTSRPPAIDRDAAIEKRDIGEWAAANDVVTTHETTKPA